MPRKRKPVPEPEKRLVLLNLTGRLAGIHQISGTDRQAKAELGVDTLPTYIEDGTEDGNSASLIQVKPRFMLYRENTPPEKQNAFNPSQV